MLNEDDGPKVDVKATGTAQARSFKFTFSGLKGEQGDPGTAGHLAVRLQGGAAPLAGGGVI